MQGTKHASLVMLLAPLIALTPIPLHEQARAQRTAQLMSLARAGNANSQEVQRLLGGGADVNARFAGGRSLLHFAADRDNPTLVAALQKAGATSGSPERGAVKSMRRRLVRGALKTCVANNGSIATAQKLLAAGADINWRGNGDSTPLAIAISNEDVPMVQFLISNRANFRAKTNGNLTMIQLALRDGGNLATLNVLKSLGAPSDPISELMIAVLRSKEKDVEKWLRSGVAIDAENANKDGWTSLMWAASCGDPVITKLLLKHGANPNLKDNSGSTLVDIANQSSGMSTSGIASRTDFKKTIQILKKTMATK